MNHSEIKAVVEKSIKDCQNYNFVITMANGDKERKRLFISNDGFVCEFKKRSRTRGRCISCEELWKLVKPIEKNADKVNICKRNIRSVVKYLMSSGFWPDIYENMVKLQGLSDDDLKYLCECEYDDHNRFMQEREIDHISPDMFSSLSSGRGIITINWGQGHDWIKQGWLAALREKRNYSMRWTVSYDNSVEFNPDGNRAWYSEEYRGCGNGHYYLLLDEKHAAFREDD